MKKSKHFRKDVIIARIIAALICIALIVVISSVVSMLIKSSKDTQKDTQRTESQYMDDENELGLEPGIAEDSEFESESESESEFVSESEMTSESESESESAEIYVRTTAQVKFRSEPNTNCAILGFINYGEQALLLEELNGWYKVLYNGQEGYISADYSRIVE